MKRIMLALAICMALTLCACSNAATTTEKETGTGTSAVGTVSETDTSTPAVSGTDNPLSTEPAPSDMTTSETPQTLPSDASAPTTEPEKTPSTEQPTKPSETGTQQTQPPAHSHRYSASVTAPTCTAQGYTTYTCACGHSYRADTTAALGHQAGDWVTTAAAKVGVAGQRERRCTRCGTVMQTEAIPALRDPNSVTPEESARIIREVSAYAESYKAKGYTFEWLDSMKFGWDIGYMGTPRIRYEGVDGVIGMLKYHIDLIVSTTTDPANGLTTNRMTYKAVQVTLDNGDIAFVVLYGG